MTTTRALDVVLLDGENTRTLIIRDRQREGAVLLSLMLNGTQIPENFAAHAIISALDAAAKEENP